MQLQIQLQLMLLVISMFYILVYGSFPYAGYSWHYYVTCLQMPMYIECSRSSSSASLSLVWMCTCHSLNIASFTVAVTQILWRPRGLLVDQFDSKEDLINAVVTSSFIPG